MSDKEKLNIYVNDEVARAIKMESARLGITQGDLIAEMWGTYQKKDQAQAQETEEQAEISTGIDIEEMQKRKQMQEQKNARELKIKKAKEILNDWTRFDLETIELYARRMHDIGEKKLAKELKDLADFKRRSI